MKILKSKKDTRNLPRLGLKVALFVAIVSGAPSCGSESPDDKEDAPKIVDVPPRASTLTLLAAQIPKGPNSYFSLGPDDFINGHYDQDIVAAKPPVGLSGETEEATAKDSAIFLSAPGLLWQVDPPSPVTVTLTARGKSQTIKRNVDLDSNRLAVSFLSFPEVYPPVFRERYEITVSSYPGVASPFSYTYTFNVRRSDAAIIYAQVLPGDPVSSIRLGMDTSAYTISKIAPSELCPQCTIEVEKLTLTARVKYFVELPAIPAPGDLRITFPKRFSGLLVKNVTQVLNPLIVGNNTDAVSLTMAIPGSLTSVEPWCVKKIYPVGVCSVSKGGNLEPTYFRFLNAVPKDISSQSLGGINGVASVSVSGEGFVTIRRDGHVMEQKTVAFDSGEYSPLDSPLLPNWVLDDLRNALFSGAPEFKL